MNCYARLALFAALSIVATAQVSQTLAANYSWNVGSAGWSFNSSWNPSTVPGPADTAWVVNGGTAGIGGLVFASCGTLAVGGAGSGNVQLSAAGSMTAGSGGELIGYSGSGVFSQTGGTNTTTANGLILGNKPGSSGLYNFSGGLLTTAILSDGNSGSGTFNQSGGTNTISSGNSVDLGANPGSSGSYSLSGGYLVSPVEYAGLGGSGAFTQTGGTNSVLNYLTLGHVAGVSGSYNLSGNGYVSALYSMWAFPATARSRRPGARFPFQAASTWVTTPAAAGRTTLVAVR